MPDDDPEYQGVSGQFAGIEMSEFYWARQRANRALLFWVVAVLTLTGLVAVGAWTLGGNIAALI
jgi:serine/threonine-protein kinase